MEIDLVFPVLPPTLDGIGDHTARLAEALSRHASVRVLTAQSDAEPIPGVAIEEAFSYPPRRGVLELSGVVSSAPSDWVVLQFNQFSYGRWGLNPFLPSTLYRLQQACPEVNVAVLFHEDFLPADSWTNAIMTSWQRAQFWALGRLADHVFFSIAPWVQEYQSWFPGTPVHHLPVGSNIPRVDAHRDEVRRELGISADAFVAGVFGSLHESRLLSHIRGAARALEQHARRFQLLYVGPHGNAFKEAMNDIPVLDAGCLPAPDVSRCFTAMDLYLAPFIDGVSTRRGSFMTGIQHGVPTLTTSGPLTDPVLRNAHGDALRMVPVDAPCHFADDALSLWRDPEYRQNLGSAGLTLYEYNFTFEAIADRLIDRLHMEVTV